MTTLTPNTAMVVAMPMAITVLPPVLAGQAKLKAQEAIYRLEDLVKEKKYSRQRLWREFFDREAKRLGSHSAVVRLLSELSYSDGKIFEWLKVSDFSNGQIVKILEGAQWADTRMADSVMIFEYDGVFDYTVKVPNDIDILDFLLTSGVSDVRVMIILFNTHRLYRKTINRMIHSGWTESRVLMAVIESGCFNKKTREMMLGPENKPERARWTDGKMLVQMEQLKISDSVSISLFKNAGLLLKQIYCLCRETQWTQERISAAFIEAGISAGELACALVYHAKESIETSEYYMNYCENKNPGSYKKVRGAIEALKILVITILEKMKNRDGDVFSELNKLDWSNAEIIDYMLAAGWTPERIMRAMLEAGWSEYYIDRVINASAEEYERKSLDIWKFQDNQYWKPEIIKLWKMVLRKIVPQDDILKQLDV